MGSQGTKPSEADSFLGTVIQKVSYGFESKLPECQPADLRQKRCRKRIWCILTLKSDIWLHQVLPVFLRINEHTAQLLVPSNAVWPATKILDVPYGLPGPCCSSHAGNFRPPVRSRGEVTVEWLDTKLVVFLY